MKIIYLVLFISFNSLSIAFDNVSIYFLNNVIFSNVLNGNVNKNDIVFDVIDSNLLIKGIHLTKEIIAEEENTSKSNHQSKFVLLPLIENTVTSLSPGISISVLNIIPSLPLFVNNLIF